jgi:hypothetical protein
VLRGVPSAQQHQGRYGVSPAAEIVEGVIMSKKEKDFFQKRVKQKLYITQTICSI